MIKKIGWAAIAVCSLVCLEAQARELRGWVGYTGYTGMRGLHLKPVIVVFGHRCVMVNQQSTTTEGAFRLLEKSQKLSPLADILVRAGHGRSAAAQRFMKRVSDAGMCEDRKCLYRFSR